MFYHFDLFILLTKHPSSLFLQYHCLPHAFSSNTFASYIMKGKLDNHNLQIYYLSLPFFKYYATRAISLHYV